MPTILVVDDEPQIRRFLRIGLGSQGYRLLEAATGNDALAICAEAGPDLVILDLGLPDRDGQEVIKALRTRSSIPIIVLSVRAAEAEKIAALDHGANDYVTKPFGIGELNARVRAALRRQFPDEPAEPLLRVGELMIDLAKRRITVGGEAVKLSKKEFDLLALLVRRAGRVTTHRQLLREVWGPLHEEDIQYLRVYIGQLRQKLHDDPQSPRFITNEPGVGYRFLLEGDIG